MNSSGAGEWVQTSCPGIHFDTTSCHFVSVCNLNIWSCFDKIFRISLIGHAHYSSSAPAGRDAHTRWAFNQQKPRSPSSAHEAVWQVTAGETCFWFQGQCCNLQVKHRNSIPVRGDVAPKRSVFPHCEHPCLSSRSSLMCVNSLSLHVHVSMVAVSTRSTSAGAGTQACSSAGCCANKAHGVMKPNVKAGTMLGSPNSLSLPRTEPRLTSQIPGEAADSRRGSSKAPGTATGNTDEADEIILD